MTLDLAPLFKTWHQKQKQQQQQNIQVELHQN